MVQKIDATIAKLRLVLANVKAKEQQYEGVRHQFREQLRRVVEYGVYGESSLDSTLGAMAEIQQRLADTEAAARDLGLIRARAERELESLQLTKRIEAARATLQKLREQRQALTRAGTAEADGQELDEQILLLQQEINEASEQAARTLGKR